MGLIFPAIRRIIVICPHLLGLFPGDLITVDNAKYMEAAKYSMRQRGDDATGWGVGQRINSWARTGDGNHAYQLVKTA